MNQKGHLHPVTQLIREIVMVFSNLGYAVATGPELEQEYYNFDALNIPKDHPSRDMQDTFWIKGKPGFLLTTQTSAIQIRFMEKNKPPVKIVYFGKTFRNEATDATHEVQFTQLEALFVDEKASVADLKGMMTLILKSIFGEDVEIRFRPSFFPFTEPSLEVDMKWKGKWLEIAGSGLVHPNVLKTVGIDTNKYCGLAFAFGLDRLLMLKYGVDDIRHLYTGDLRFVNQF